MIGSSLANPIAAVAGAGINAIGAAQQRKFEASEAQKQRDWNEQMQDKANAWNLEMWNKTNEYNSPIEQVQRLRDAGLNPLYYGLDGSSANAMQSAQALGYDRASASAFDNPLSAGFEGATAAMSLKKDIELKNAQIDKLSQDTEGVRLDNEFKDKTMKARTEAEELKNSLSKEQIENAKKERQRIEQDIKKKIAETESEQERKSLIIAQAAVQRASEKEILELLPYKKLLTEAQTEAQKAAAAASFAHAMYEREMLDSGYIDELARAQKGIADNAAAQSAINQWKDAVKHGNVYAINDDDFFLTKAGKHFLNGLFNNVSMVGEALTGGLAGVLK